LSDFRGYFIALQRMEASNEAAFIIAAVPA